MAKESLLLYREDEDLQRQWAALLANAATLDNRVLPAFAEILHQLTPVQARILRWMYEMRVQPMIADWPDTWPDVARVDIESAFGLSHADYALLVTDRERFNLVEPRRDIEAGTGTQVFPPMTAPLSVGSIRSHPLHWWSEGV